MAAAAIRFSALILPAIGHATLCMGRLCAAQRLCGDEIHGLDGREAQAAAVGLVERRGALASRGNETHHDFSVGGKDHY